MEELSPFRGWFSLNGRRARLSYFLATLAQSGIAFMGAFLGVLPLITYSQKPSSEAGLTMLAGLGALLILAVVLFACVGPSFLIAQRARDMGWKPSGSVSGYWALFAFGFLVGWANGINPGSADEWEAVAGLASLIFGLVLLFKRGAERPTFRPVAA